MSLDTEVKENELEDEKSEESLEVNSETNLENELEDEKEKTIVFQKLADEVTKENLGSTETENLAENTSNTQPQEEKKFNNYEKNTDKNFNNYSKEKTKNKKVWPIILIFVIFILIALVLSTVFALVNSNNKKILNNITINSIDVSNLTIEEAKQKLESELKEKISATYKLTYEDYETSFTPSDIDASFDIDSTIKNAYEIGRKGNIFESNFEIISTLLSPTELKPELKYDEEKLNTILKNINADLPGLVTESSYYINDGNLIITKGIPGITMQTNKLKESLISLISSSNTNTSTPIVIPVQKTEPNEIDLEKIYKEVHKQPSDAYIIKEPFELHLDEDGVDFGISMEEAKNLLKENNSEYSIPLKYTKANVTINDLGEDAFPHELSTFTTRYDETNVNRSINLKLASQKINGTILKPGEVFSYNKVVGERTLANGFKEAIVYANGGMEPGLGGGICQISSTLYNSVVLANLEIVERKNHSLPVTYVPLGRDATVSYGSVDFKFKNNRTYPIKIVASASSGVAKISILGIHEETEYHIEIKPQKIQSIAYTTQYINDSSLAKGTQKVVQNGAYGSKYVTYKEISLNGTLVDKVLLSTDTYNAQKRIVHVGTANNSKPSTQTPENSGQQSSSDVTITY